MITLGFFFSYYSGIFSGILLLLLYLYPLRKHVKMFHGWGKMKYWFYFHVAVGILMPTSVLFHTQLVIGSLNGAVAFYSMLVVMISGIIGRFLLVRLDRDKIWRKLFSYWHVAHIPMLYVMAITIFLHIIAVHMY